MLMVDTMGFMAAGGFGIVYHEGTARYRTRLGIEDTGGTEALPTEA